VFTGAPAQPAQPTQESLDRLGYPSLAIKDREAGKAFLKDAKPLGAPLVKEYDTSKDSLTAWEKPDGSVWVEADSVAKHDFRRFADDYRLTLRVPPGQDEVVLIDEHGTLTVPALGEHLRYGMTHGGFATFVPLADGDLQIQATRQFYEEFDAIRCQKRGTDDLLHDVLEDFRANGWQVIDCQTMNAGGEFTITNEGGDLLPDGEIGYWPHAWEHTQGATEDPIRQGLFLNGQVTFSRVTPSDWMSPEDIKAWKEETNRQMLESGDWDESQCWEL